MTQQIHIRLTGKDVNGSPTEEGRDSTRTTIMKFAADKAGVTRLLKTARWADRTGTKLLLIGVLESQH